MKYTKKQIQESIKHWQKVLESLDESASDDSVVKAMFVGIMDSMSYANDGIYNDDGIYFKVNSYSSDFVVRIKNIVQDSEGVFTADVFGGFTDSQASEFGKMTIKVLNMPNANEDFEYIADHVQKFAVPFGNGEGLFAAFNAVSDAQIKQMMQCYKKSSL